MRLILTSDTHLGESNPMATRRVIDKLWEDIAVEEPDVIVHAGDYSGNYSGAGAVRYTLSSMRRYLPDTPYLTVWGNHDYWCGNNRRSYWNKCWEKNNNKLRDAVSEFGVHLLGSYTSFQLKNYIFIGTGGWYDNISPPTNDSKYMPRYVDGKSIHDHLRDSERHAALSIIGTVPWEDASLKKIWVSHFPLFMYNPLQADPEGFSLFGGNPRLGAALEELGVDLFLQGHGHQRVDEARIMEAGSDYGRPAYIVRELT